MPPLRVRKQMLTENFNFNLPEELIAQQPPPERGAGRLMVLNRQSGKHQHRSVTDLPRLLPKNSLLVFNNTRVRKARLPGVSETGVKTDFLLLETENGQGWAALCKNAAKRRAGGCFRFPAGVEGEITGHSESGVILRFNRIVDDSYLEQYGHVPLPPYIKRQDEAADAARYQTIFARENGSAAAPTAGLHFTETLLSELAGAGIESVFVTLHVGLGTFKPVRAARIEEHRMHEEHYFVSEETAARIEKAKQDKRPVTAVGTTSARALESAWQRGRLCPGSGKTGIFIYGNYRFKVVDCLFTNFHTPFSTLLMLVSCFAGQRRSAAGADAEAAADADGGAGAGAEAGRRLILEAYACAVEQRYRFFSYGDAMLIL